MFVLFRVALVFQRDAGAIRQDAQRLAELDLLSLHQEAEDIAAGAAGAEAVPGLTIRRDVEGRRTLCVEGTQGPEIAAGAFP